MNRTQTYQFNDPNSALQNVDFTYNIRGWMRGINDVHLTEASDLFGMELSYQCASGGAVTAQYNGNISALEWASRTDEERRRYTYSYDRVNRLLEADYQNMESAPTHAGENYSVKELKYDLNGNILGLKRFGLTSGVQSNRSYGIIDHLTYYYSDHASRGNRLVGVDDSAPTATISVHPEYFNDNFGLSKVPVGVGGQNVAEYSYDENGNLISDANKNIQTIEYNHLNLPTKITFAGNKEIAYTYDAAGTKLSKTATQNGTAISQTDYVNGHIYQDGQLEFFGMAEGRMYAQRDANGNFEALKPEYHLTDHLGNLRVAWRPEQASSGRSFLMTAEPENKADEDTTFQNLAEAPKAKGYKSANSVSLSQYDAPIKKEFIPLEEGQEVEVSVLGLREILQNTEEESDIPTSTGKTKNGIVPIPIIVNGTQTHNSGDAAKQGSVRANILGIIPFAKKIFSKKEKQKMAIAPKPLPEGELVISFYDSTKELLSTEILSLKSENEWETLAFSAKADEKGFVSASIRGTSSAPAKFDDFSIQLKSLYSAKLYQENHYYPFGMNMKGLESSDKQTTQNKDEHEFQFNAQTEREESFGLFWDETPFRPMDSQLGRFWGVDLLSEKYQAATPFHYSLNNPISLNDPTGLEVDAPDWLTQIVSQSDNNKSTVWTHDATFGGMLTKSNVSGLKKRKRTNILISTSVEGEQREHVDAAAEYLNSSAWAGIFNIHFDVANQAELERMEKEEVDSYDGFQFIGKTKSDALNLAHNVARIIRGKRGANIGGFANSGLARIIWINDFPTSPELSSRFNRHEANIGFINYNQVFKIHSRQKDETSQMFHALAYHNLHILGHNAGYKHYYFKGAETGDGFMQTGNTFFSNLASGRTSFKREVTSNFGQNIDNIHIIIKHFSQ